MEVILYIFIGFCAQFIDGTLGMAYGVSCRTFLKTFAKVPSGIISAIVHYAEIPSSFSSMICHIKYKNVDRILFWNLVIPGVIGSVTGAYLITFSFDFIEIIVDIYLIIMGITIFIKGFSNNTAKKTYEKTYVRTLGFIGSFFDASGGGGWGPIVTGSLLHKSDNPKKIIGTINSSEFFVTLASSITFILLILNIKKYMSIIIGLIIGGVIASPLAAKLCHRIDSKKLFFYIGLLLIILNLYNIYIIII